MAPDEDWVLCRMLLEEVPADQAKTEKTPSPEEPALNSGELCLKMMVSVEDSNGEPDIFFCKMKCTKGQYNDGFHYDAAKNLAEEEGYESHLAYDENDPGGRAMLSLCVWESIPVTEINDYL